MTKQCHVYMVYLTILSQLFFHEIFDHFSGGLNCRGGGWVPVPRSGDASEICFSILFKPDMHQGPADEDDTYLQ